jgi:hypothetical protein
LLVEMMSAVLSFDRRMSQITNLTSAMKYLLTLLLASQLHAAEAPITIALSGTDGLYTVERWKQDWPGCEFEDGIKEGHVSLRNRDGIPWLRVNYTIGGIGPEKGGAGWRWPIGTHEAAELRYSLRFNEDFDFVKGGKLPGLSGGPENVSGGRPSDGNNGFSARLMWRRDGRGEAYVYHKNQPDKYGHSFPFPDEFRFPTGKPVQVRIGVTMNTPKLRDGKLRVWITLPEAAERLVVEQTQMEWRNTSSFGVDSLYFETFHGGNDSTWAPTRACWAEFGKMEVSRCEPTRLDTPASAPQQ